LPKRAETFRKTPLKLPRFPPARLNDHVFRIPEIPKNTHSDRYRGRARHLHEECRLHAVRTSTCPGLEGGRERREANSRRQSGPFYSGRFE